MSSTASPSTAVPVRNSVQIDPRGPRFTAGVTLVVFAAVLLTAPSTAAVVLLAVQTAFFGLGAGRGVQYTPTAYVFKKVIRPRLSSPTHTEDAKPPRFAQTVGLVFTAVALVAFAVDLDTLGFVFAAFALAAAFLNAVFGFCLGCELYLLGKRLSSSTTHPDSTTNEANKEEVTA
jgi:disulfide bond formation protein DsbB